MNTMNKKSPLPAAVPPRLSFPDFSVILPAVFSLLIFLIPVVPDIRLSRPKLLLIEIALYGLIFAWVLINSAAKTAVVRFSYLIFPVSLYAGFMVSYALLSPDRGVTANELQRILLSLLAYVLAVQILTDEKIKRVFVAAWLSGAALSVTYGILQHFGGVGRLAVPFMERIASTFGNPIFFAAFVLATVPLAFGAFLTVRAPSVKMLLLALAAAGVYALYLTGTRAAFIGLFAAIVLFSLLVLSSLRWKLAVIGAAVVAAVLFAATHMALVQRHQAHVLIWRDTLVLWLHHPVLGTGPGTFHLYFPPVASDELKRVWPQGQFIVNDAHNEYLQSLAETGIVGSGIFIAVLFFFFTHAFRTFRSLGNRRERFLLAGTVTAVGALLVENFFSVDMRFTVSSVLLFLLIGLADTSGETRVMRFSLPLTVRGAGAAGAVLAAFYVFPAILAPYIAQKKCAETPGFFDEKILEPLKTTRELESLATQYPGQAPLFEKLGWVYAKEKNWAKAIENLKKATALDPRRAGPLNNLGNVYFLTGDRKHAIACWQQSLRIDPRQPDSGLNLATAYYYEGNLKEAAEQLKEVLKIDPGNMRALVLLKEMTE